jgi:hypothetical protein
MSIAYSECVFVALGIEHAMRMRSIVLSSLAYPGQRHFYKLSDKMHDFRKKKLLNIKRGVLKCDFDRASSLICGNKIPTRCNRFFLLQILLLALVNMWK